MMKLAVRQQRHRLKKKYFDPFPLHSVRKTSPVKCMDNQQWLDLVESWMDPKKWSISSSQPNSCLVYATLARALITCKLYLMQETCEKNKENRELVKYHQTTGSRSYMVVIDNLVSKPWFSCSCIVWSN